VLESLGIEAQINEWFEYGGRPNFFELTITDLNSLMSRLDDFIKMLNSYKRATAHLDRMIFRLSRVPVKLYAGVGAVTKTIYKIPPSY
jgi:P2-related tail formation protein